MEGLVAGVLALGVASLVDVATLRGWPRIKPLLFIAAVLLFSLAIYDVCFQSDRFPLPLPAQQVGLVLLPLSALLFVYTEFVEIPLTTYWQGSAPSRLVNTGTYALCRHPGVWWAGLLLASLTLVSRSTKLLAAAPVWLAVDILWVWVQDRYFFPRLIPGYREYQRQTPMLWPSRQSLSACLSTSLAKLRPRPVSRSKGG